MPKQPVTRRAGARRTPRKRRPTGAGARRRDGRQAGLRGTARKRLLDAAARVFAARGYRDASVDDVVADAGLTKGALYWNFEGKEDLFFTLVEERVDRRLRELIEVTESASAEEETASRVGRGAGAVMDEEGELVLLLNEYWSLAVRDPTLNERLAERQGSLRTALAGALEARHELLGVPLSVPAERLSTMIIALGNGLAMARLTDPAAVPPDLYGEALSLLYDGLVLRARG